jgi:hypothetical protein
VVGHSSKWMPVFRSGRALVAFALVVVGLLSSVSVAAATEQPETPVSEACGGPVSPGSLRLCGTLNPNASAKVGYHFAYNTDGSCTGGGTTPPGEEVEGEAVGVSGELTGVQPGTAYTYCLIATTSAGEAIGGSITVVTAGVAPPQAPLTEACGGPVSPGSLRLCGTLNPNASAKVGYYFAYNTDGSCTGGGTTPPGEEVEGNDVAVSAELTGVQPGTAYTYCLIATTSAGEAIGGSITVSTAPQPLTSPITTSAPQQLPESQRVSPASSPTSGAPPGPVVATSQSSKPLTHAQKRAQAEWLCKRGPKRQRSRCLRRARVKYGVRPNVRPST